MRNIKKRLSVWALIVAAVLLIPYFFMPLWTPGDFVFAAVVLFGSAFVYEMVTKNMANYNHRLTAGFIVAAVLAFIWVGAATGFEGVPTHPVTLYMLSFFN